MTATVDTLSDRDLALAFQAGIEIYNATGDDEVMIEAENEICDRLDLSPDETEQGLTVYAVGQIDAFITKHTTDTERS